MKTIALDIRLIGKKRTGDETVIFHLTKALLAIERDQTERRYLLLTDEHHPAKLAVIRGRLGCIGQANVEIVSLGNGNRFAWNLWSVPLFLLRRRVDVYHTQYILPFFIPRRTRAVTLVHDVSFKAYPEFIAASDRLFLALLIPPSLRRASKIIAVSQFTKDEIVKHYGIKPEKIVVIPNAPQDIFLVEAPKPDAALKQKYRLPEEYFLYVGTLQPRKNIPFLLEAWARVRERLPQTRLVVVGSRTAHNVDLRIEPTIARLKLEDSIHFPGYVDEADLPSLIRGAQLFIFPTLYEGFGIPILEAISQRVPVVASDIPSLREVGGEAVAFVSPGDIASMAEKMYSLSIALGASDRQVLIEAGTRRLAAYGWPSSAALLVALYRELSQ